MLPSETHNRQPIVITPFAEPALLRRSSFPKLSQSDARPGKLFDDVNEDETGSDAEFEGQDVVQLATPGDLQLCVEIARLEDKILDLVKQDHFLDTLIRQAELTGNQAELRILRRSQTSVRREQRTTIFQKAQFEQQDEENRLVPGRTSVTIPSSVITEDEGGKQVVRYTIEVKQSGEDGDAELVWVVARRYNEFWELDRAIRDRAAIDPRLLEVTKRLELPPKKLVPNISSSFVDARRVGLEKYLMVSQPRHLR